MPERPQITLRLSSPERTATLAKRIAPLLNVGDCILLGGAIGAGKTHFARAVIQARLAESGRLEDVPSPTFTIVQTYDDGQAEIWHADLYRLIDPDEIEELGLSDAFTTAICLVEWPENLGHAVPDDPLRLNFAAGAEPDERILTAEGAGARWRDVLAVLALQARTPA